MEQTLQMTAADKELIQSCKEGNIRAFELLFNRHKLRMYNIAFRIHKNHLDAEDSVQEAFLKIYRKINSFKGKSSFTTWIYRIVVNTCLNNMRKAKKHRDSLSGEQDNNQEFDNISPHEEKPELKIILEREIARLSDVNRTVFVLYEIEGFSHQEIGKILSIPVGTSKSRLFEAKTALKKALNPYKEHLL